MSLLDDHRFECYFVFGGRFKKMAPVEEERVGDFSG